MAKPEKIQEGAPDEVAVSAMREHREIEDQRTFDLTRHVDYPGHKRKRAPITYVPAAPGRLAYFHCRLCPGKVFLIGDPFEYSDPVSQQRWLRRHSEAAPAIRRLPAEHRGRAIGAHESGEVGAHAYEQWLAKGLQRTVPKGRRAEDAARIEGCQRQMLTERLEGKLVKEIIEGLLEMQVKEPERWRELIGGKTTVTEPTLRRYWRSIPKPARDATAAEAKAQAETGKASALGERLLAALSPLADLPVTGQPPDPGAHAKRSTLPPPGVLKERGGPGARRQR